MTDVAHERPGWAAVAGATLAVELRRWSRNRVAVASALVLPLLMAGLISVALGDDLSSYSTEVAVVDLDGGPAADVFRDDALGHPAVAGAVEVREAGTAAEARRLVDDDEVGAAVVLQEGLTASIAEGGPSRIEVVRSGDDPIAGDLVALVVNGFEVRARATTLAAGQEAAEPPGPWPLEVEVSSLDGGSLTAAAHYGPSLGLFFVLLTMGFAAARLVADRQHGVVDRLATTPVASSAVLVGRALAGLVVGAVSLATVAVAMPLLFGTPWGPPGAVLAVSAAVVVSLAGVAALIAGLSRTPQQAQALALTLSFVLALASGSLAPPGAATRPFFADLAPTTHAIDAYATLTTGAGGLASVAPSIGILLAFGAVCLALTSFLDWRTAA